MRFDVIIGNPPYQEKDGGHGASAKPIYNIFIEKSIEIEPRYLSMIVPSRWMNGGKGLNDFRKRMKEDKRLKIIVDFLDSSDIFDGVDISGGVNYFLWDSKYNGLCNFNGLYRDLEEFDHIVRDNKSIDILRKVLKQEDDKLIDGISTSKPFGLRTYFSDYVEKPIISNKLIDSISTRKPFGICTNFNNFKDEPINNKNIKIYGNRNLMKETNGVGYVSIDQVIKNKKLINKHKVIIPYAGDSRYNGKILSTPIYSEPNSICSETYIIIKVCENKEECERLISYIKTKFFRFLVGLIKDTQHATKRVYGFVPDLPLYIEWNDKKLYSKYKLTQDEIQHIESMIRPMK